MEALTISEMEEKLDQVRRAAEVLDGAGDIEIDLIDYRDVELAAAMLEVGTTVSPGGTYERVSFVAWLGSTKVYASALRNRDLHAARLAELRRKADQNAAANAQGVR